MSRGKGFWGKFGVTVAGAALVVAGATAATTAHDAQPTQTAVTVQTRTGPNGPYLTDGQGNSLYLFVADTGNTSTCTGQCAVAWPPLVGSPHAGNGVDQSKLATSARSGGAQQVTYNNHPLYRYVGDNAAGQTNGQGLNQFGALWWLVNPSGNAITGTSSPGGGVTY